jgi:hypothetical protein
MCACACACVRACVCVHAILMEPPGVLQTSSSGSEAWVTGPDAAWVALHVVVTMGTVHILPRWSKVLPSSLVAVALCVALEHGVVRPLGFRTKSIGDVAVRRV